MHHLQRGNRRVGRLALVATLASVLLVPGGADAAPRSDAVSGLAVRADGVPAGNAIVSLMTDGTTAPAAVVAGITADNTGYFEAEVPAADDLIEIAKSSGNFLGMNLGIQAISYSGTTAEVYAYTGHVTAELVNDAFVVINQTQPYILQAVDDSSVDLAPKTKVWVDSAEGDSIHLQGASTPQLDLSNVLAIGATPVTGPYRKTIAIAPDGTQIAAAMLNSSSQQGRGIGGVAVDLSRVGEVPDAGEVAGNAGAIAGAGVEAAGEAAAQSTVEGSCNPRGEGSPMLYAYKPMHVGADPQDNSLQTDYTVIRYQRNKAHFRLDSLEWTWQVLMCGFGGSKAMNGWRLLRAGMVIATYLPTKKKTNLRVGQSWDNENNDKVADSTLGFKVDAGPVSVDVSIPTKTAGTLEGSFGVKGPQEDNVSKTSLTNSVHSWWQDQSAPWTAWWAKGSRDFQGVVDEGVYEMGEQSQPTAKSMMQVFWEVHCTSKNPCPLYN